jgi:hypothetical protein
MTDELSGKAMTMIERNGRVHWSSMAQEQSDYIFRSLTCQYRLELLQEDTYKLSRGFTLIGADRKCVRKWSH